MHRAVRRIKSREEEVDALVKMTCIDTRNKTLHLEPRATREKCAHVICARVCVLITHTVAHKGIAISCKRNSLYEAPTFEGSTRIVILSMPTRTKMRRIKCSIPIAFLEWSLASLMLGKIGWLLSCSSLWRKSLIDLTASEVLPCPFRASFKLFSHRCPSLHLAM